MKSDQKILDHKLPSGATLRVIRDLTELNETEGHLLRPMADAILGTAHGLVFLVAANDGQLLQAWDRLENSPTVRNARTLIEGMLVQAQFRLQLPHLSLYNLSRQNSAGLMKQILRAVVDHDGWRGCDGCPGQSTEPGQRCPIWENYQRIQDPLLQQRLVSLLELSDQSGFHLPIRQLLILASNMLLGHPEARDDLMRCDDAAKLAHRSPERASIYGNTLGENLTPLLRERTEAFDILTRFGLGEETSNRIDNLLVYGGHDSELAPLFDRLVRADAMYGGFEEFLRLQTSYLEGGTSEHQVAFCNALRTQRQRLFFTVPPEESDTLGLWELTVFRYGGEFIDRVLTPLQQGDGRVDKRIVKRLVRGLNRVFTGLMTNEHGELHLASSGSYSQARVSRIREYSVSVDPRSGERVTIEREGDQPQLSVYFRRDLRISLPLHLVRFEFLSRVAEGALPTNFSRECYEDILSFKSRLLRTWHSHRDDDGPSDGGELKLDLLATEPDGRLRTINIAVRLEESL